MQNNYWKLFFSNMICMVVYCRNQSFSGFSHNSENADFLKIFEIKSVSSFSRDRYVHSLNLQTTSNSTSPSLLLIKCLMHDLIAVLQSADQQLTPCAETLHHALQGEQGGAGLNVPRGGSQSGIGL